MDEIKINDVVILHLQNSLTVIGRVEKMDQSEIILYRPMELMIARTAQGQVQVGYTPMLSLGGILPTLDSFGFTNESIMYPRSAPKKLSDGYMQATSGIQVANNVPQPSPNQPGGRIIR